MYWDSEKPDFIGVIDFYQQLVKINYTDRVNMKRLYQNIQISHCYPIQGQKFVSTDDDIFCGGQKSSKDFLKS